MANDKIFNNSFDTPEFELGNISFDLDTSLRGVRCRGEDSLRDDSS